MKLTKDYGHDSMSISATFPTGGSIKFSVGWDGEKIEVAGSNNGLIMTEQSKVANKYLKFRKGETNKDRFARFETLLTGGSGWACECGSVASVITRMKWSLGMIDGVETVQNEKLYKVR